MLRDCKDTFSVVWNDIWRNEISVTSLLIWQDDYWTDLMEIFFRG